MDSWVMGLAILIIGMIMLGIEAFTPGMTFMAIPGTVAVVLGVLAMLLGPWLFSEFWYAPVIAVVIAIPVTAITVWGYKKLSKGHPPTTTVGDSLIGRQGIVTVEVLPDSIKGKVKIGNETWSATSERPIPAGAKIEVVASEGVHVTVETIENIAVWERQHRSEGMNRG
jgi:membrane protein implicated in regulation of membrane protease activity